MRERSLTAHLADLNPEQKRAVLYRDGPLLILAGAGSGKTKTMATRIAHLIGVENIPARNILGLSFTNKAARELKERVFLTVNRQFPSSSTQGLVLTTFHSLCVRILREFGERLGFSKNFTIVDESDQIDVLKQILKTFNLDDRKFDVHSILFQFGQAKNKLIDHAQMSDHLLGLSARETPSDYAIAAASSFSKYQDKLLALNAMDFDDLIFNTVRLLEKDSQVRKVLNQRYRYILVDEYQDTNPAQFRILKLLTEMSQNLCVVGDDDQSIYSWRGADPHQILGFQKHYPKAQLITLNQNYRSTSSILKAANQVISKNTQRHVKELWSQKGDGHAIQQIIVDQDRDEADAVADHIARLAFETHQGVKKQVRSFKDFAILYRSNAQSRLFEEALRRNRLPYKMVGGMSFLERKEVKDVLAYWRAIVNPSDDASVRRIINWPARGIGKTTIEAVHQHAIKARKSFYESLFETPELNDRAKAAVKRFTDLIVRLKETLIATPLHPEALSSWAKSSLTLIEAKKALDEEESEDPARAARRYENIDELCNGFGQLQLHPPHAQNVDEASAAHATDPIGALTEYLAQLTLQDLDEKDDGEDEHKDEITLLTLHSSKGLEFPVVFLVGMEEGFLPHQRTLDEGSDISEERRLCYVGITRAKERLFFTRTKNRVRYGKALPRYPSRFIDDISKELIETRDESLVPDLSSPEAREKHETRVQGFLSELRGILSKQS